MSTFWLNCPPVLIKNCFDINPFNCDSDKTQKFNSLARLIIITTIVMFFIFKDRNIALAGILSLGISIILFYSNNDNSSNEYSHKMNDDTPEQITEDSQKGEYSEFWHSGSNLSTSATAAKERKNRLIFNHKRNIDSAPAQIESISKKIFHT
jgi:hypothetical protein